MPGAVQGFVAGADGGVLVPVSVLAQQMLQQVVRAEPDGAVHRGHGDPVACLAQGLPPAHRVQVVGVYEGAVHVEDGSVRTHGDASLRRRAMIDHSKRIVTHRVREVRDGAAE